MLGPWRAWAAATAYAFPIAAAHAQAPYRGPWDAQTNAAAEAAVARLGAKRAVEIRASVVSLRGLESRTDGVGTAIVANVRDVQQAMRDLGAKETQLEVRVELPADVLFDFDKADIRSDAARALAHVATLIRAHPGRPVVIEGHTDSIGSAAYNERLSTRRAGAVKRWLVEREAIEASRLTTKGLGRRRPVASNASEDGRQKNRRVEVVVRKR